MIDTDKFFNEQGEGGKLLEISRISREIYDLYNDFKKLKNDYEKTKNIHSLALADSISGKIIDLLNIRFRKLGEIKSKSVEIKERQQIEDSIIGTVNFIKHIRKLRKEINLDT